MTGFSPIEFGTATITVPYLGDHKKDELEVETVGNPLVFKQILFSVSPVLTAHQYSTNIVFLNVSKIRHTHKLRNAWAHGSTRNIRIIAYKSDM